MNFDDIESDEEDQRSLTAREIRALLKEQDAKHKEEIRLLREELQLQLSSWRDNNTNDYGHAIMKQHEIAPRNDCIDIHASMPNRFTSKRRLLLFRNTSEDIIEGRECLEEDTFSLMMLNKPLRDIPYCNAILVRIFVVLGVLVGGSLFLTSFAQRIMGIDPSRSLGEKPFYWALVATNFMISCAALSNPWLLSLFTFTYLQMGIGLYIIMDQASFSRYFDCEQGDVCLPFDIPMNSYFGMAMVQYLTVIFVIATQNDLFSSLQTLGKLRYSDDVPWDEVIGEKGVRTWQLWVLRILLPNVFKFIQATVILFASFLVAIRSSRIIDLLKDLTALLIVSEGDNIIFHIADLGYFGENMAQKTEEVKAVHWVAIEKDREGDDGEGQGHLRRRNRRSFCKSTGACIFFVTLNAFMLGGLSYFVAGQFSGKWIRKKYPHCNAPRLTEIGNQICNDTPLYNTAECGWDGGDCPEPAVVKGYINCAVSYPDKIGDGVCHDWHPYNTEECGYDGMDCVNKEVEGYPFCFVANPDRIGNGSCDDFSPYNTHECGYDGGDCTR